MNVAKKNVFGPKIRIILYGTRPPPATNNFRLIFGGRAVCVYSRYITIHLRYFARASRKEDRQTETESERRTIVRAATAAAFSRILITLFHFPGRLLFSRYTVYTRTVYRRYYIIDMYVVVEKKQHRRADRAAIARERRNKISTPTHWSRRKIRSRRYAVRPADPRTHAGHAQPPPPPFTSTTLLVLLRAFAVSRASAAAAAAVVIVAGLLLFRSRTPSDHSTHPQRSYKSQQPFLDPLPPPQPQYRNPSIYVHIYIYMRTYTANERTLTMGRWGTRVGLGRARDLASS